MSDEEDYMSDAFLAKLEDVKPSLIKSNADKRKLEQLKQREEQQQNKHKPIHQVQKEKLKEGLNKALTEDNKGFAMLSKMGFKPGSCLGKTSSPSAIKVPISINIHSDGRSGLGTQTVIRENQERQLNNLKRKMNANDLTPEDYRKQMREATDKKQIVWDLHKLQKTCRILDLEHSIKFPIHPWFWPKDFSRKDDSSEEEQEDENAEAEPELSVSWKTSLEIFKHLKETYILQDATKLDMLRKFLRNSYFYCEYCGHQYKDAKDLMDNCPGPLKDDH